MEVGLKMCPIFVRKILNNTEIGIGGRNKAGIPKFFTQTSVGVCGQNMEVVLEMPPTFVRKLRNNTEIGIG